jgi:hypothetical protein
VPLPLAKIQSAETLSQALRWSRSGVSGAGGRRSARKTEDEGSAMAAPQTSSRLQLLQVRAAIESRDRGP